MKSAQIWGMDLMIAVTVFSLGVLIFYFYSINLQSESQEIFETLAFEGDGIIESLFSEGYPKNWDLGNVVVIGILSGGKINQTKILGFYDLTQADYDNTKALFNTKYDYYFFLDDVISSPGGDIDGIGKPGVDPANIDSENLIKISRIVVYEDKPMNAYLYVWG